MTNKLDTHHPKPCADCDHRNLHGEVSGCIANTAPPGEPARWCPCATYRAPGAASARDRVADRAAGVQAGREGADAAFHGHAMTHDATGWRERAEERMVVLIDGGEEFTAEDVTDVVGQAPSPNAIGGLFRTFSSDVETVGYRTATRKAARGRALRVVKGKAKVQA